MQTQENVEMDDFMYYKPNEKLTKKGFYCYELGKCYIARFKTKQKRDAFIAQEKSRYDFKCETFEIK